MSLAAFCPTEGSARSLCTAGRAASSDALRGVGTFAPAFAPAAPYAEAAAEQPGDARGEAIVRRLAARFREMPDYEAVFRIEGGSFEMSGRYAVSGEAYYLAVEGAEVFCDGTVRFEVNKRLQEVTVEAVSRESRNLLDNPTRAFDFADSAYAPRFAGERNGELRVQLTPLPGSDGASGTVTVVVSAATGDPVRIEYDYDGDTLAIQLLSVRPSSAPLPRFSAANYPGYEFIDFR